MKGIRFALAALSLVFATNAVGDDSFVCGQHIIEAGTGMTREMVRMVCGEPTTQDADRWYYENQPGGVTVVLTFQIGTLEQIETLPKQ